MRDDRAFAVRTLVGGAQTNTCYFRTAAGGDGRKALLQITERCNLHCAHCFVSATRHGADLSLEVIRDRVLPRLVAGDRAGGALADEHPPDPSGRAGCSSARECA